MAINDPRANLLLAIARREAAALEAAMKEKLAEQAAEIEALRAKGDHAAISSKGGKGRQKALREDVEAWLAIAERVGKKARYDEPFAKAKDIAGQVIDECDKQGVDHPKSARVQQVLSDLVTQGKIVPRAERRK
jgi:putative heme iron utilization protein